MRDMITKHHPEFADNASLRKYAMKNPEIFNVERLVEQTLAELGHYDFVDGDHYDFSDYSDSKTASIRVNPRKPGGNSFGGEIAGVETAGGGRKRGALRCTVFNPHEDQLHYYFLPVKMWSRCITIHPTTQVGKILYSYYRPDNTIAKFEPYECESVTALAQAR